MARMMTKGWAQENGWDRFENLPSRYPDQFLEALFGLDGYMTEVTGSGRGPRLWVRAETPEQLILAERAWKSFNLGLKAARSLLEDATCGG